MTEVNNKIKLQIQNIKRLRKALLGTIKLLPMGNSILKVPFKSPPRKIICVLGYGYIGIQIFQITHVMLF